MKKDADAKILGILRKNGRAGNTEIAKKVGLSEGAVRSRIARMVREGTIRKFTIETGGKGENSAIVLAKAKGDTKKMMRGISRLGIASGAFEISGAYDGCIIIEGESVTEIDGKIDKVRGLSGVSETQTFIVLRKW
jgi:DNA-binding Lrp family transcriptional regulator